MQITELEDGQYYIIQIFGDVDASSSIALDKALADAVIKGKTKILIDCTNLAYIASAGLGVFISYMEEFKERNIGFGLFGLSDKAKNVFSILGLDKLLIMVPTKEEAKRLTG